MAYSTRQPVQPRKRRMFFRPLPLGIALLVLVGAVITVLEVTNTTHLFHSAPVAKTSTIPSSSPSAPSSSKGGSTPNSSSPAAPGQSTSNVAGSSNKGGGDTGPSTPASTTSGEPPATPSGTFISNHSPNLSGNPFPSEEQSVCNTTPGATCNLTFTKDDLTRTLAAQTANSDGSALWTWDVKQAGFTEGTWTVTVTATLNGQTTSAKDSLKVGP